MTDIDGPYVPLSFEVVEGKLEACMNIIQTFTVPLRLELAIGGHYNLVILDCLDLMGINQT